MSERQGGYLPVKILILFALSSTVVGERAPQDDDISHATGTSRIPVWKGEFPFLASVTNYRNGTRNRCTGSLIEKDVVLTAGHCADGSSVSVRVGGRTRSVLEWELHPDYDPSLTGSTEKVKNDIAKIYLRDPVEDIAPVSLYYEVRKWDVGVAVDKSHDWKVPIEVGGVGDHLSGGSPKGYIESGDSGGPLLFWTLEGWVQGGVVSASVVDDPTASLFARASNANWDDPDPDSEPSEEETIEYSETPFRNGTSLLYVRCSVPKRSLGRPPWEKDCTVSGTLASPRKRVWVGCHFRDSAGEVVGSGSGCYFPEKKGWVFQPPIPEYADSIRCGVRW